MKIQQTFYITEPEVGLRIDVVLVRHLRYSRTLVAQWLKDGQILVNQGKVTASKKVKLADLVTVLVVIQTPEKTLAEKGPLSVCFEDDDLIVINKPAGLVVHPGAGIQAGTLLNRLYYHYPEVKILPRGGIVHRLDKDTTGLMIIARNLISYQLLVKMFANRQVEKIYRTIVVGQLITGGMIEANITRDVRNRTLKQVCVEGGLYALTRYWVIKRYLNFTELKVKLETGRTHQIRVHFSYLGFPIVGDPAYNHRTLSTKIAAVILKNVPATQLLHAEKLSFLHPIQQTPLTFEAPLPSSFLNFKLLLEQNNSLA